MRFTGHVAFLLALSPLIAGSPLDFRHDQKEASHNLGLSSPPKAADPEGALRHEDYELYSSAANDIRADGRSRTCPASSKGSARAQSSLTRWVSSLVRRTDDFGSLSIPTKGKPIEKWAAEIYESSNQNREVFIDFDTHMMIRATSRFEKFGDEQFYMTLTGLYGCTGVIVTSYCGAYMAHFWEKAMDEDTYKGNPAAGKKANKNAFLASVADPLEGIRNKAAEQAANAAIVWEQAMLPDKDFVSLSAHKTCLSKAMGAKAFIFTPLSSADATKLKNPTTAAALKSVIADITDLAPADIATHSYKVVGEATARARDNAVGKVLLSYSPDTKASPRERAYQVHVKKADAPEVTMVLGDTWTGDASQCTCPDSPLKVREHDRSCCKCGVQ